VQRGRRDHDPAVKIHLCYIGKARDANWNAAAAEFVKRASRYAKVEMREIHPERTDFWNKHAAATKVLLDPAGKPLDSRQVAELVRRHELEARDLVFAVGPHEGFPEEWRKRADMLMSLSKMTFPHELARAIMAEQIYRAFTMLRGHPYPR
jgi:23S rRNA (pseudouridine1915-N3)-methyltransferase